MTRQHRLPDHFLSSEDGNLYDTRVPGWSGLPPLRSNYRKHHKSITSAADLKACLRAGAHVWPGGYPLFFIDNGDDTVSWAAVVADLPCYIGAFVRNDWIAEANRVVGCDVNWEDADMFCVVTGERIPSAYAEDETPTAFEERHNGV